MSGGGLAKRQDVIELEDQPPGDHMADEFFEGGLDHAGLRIILMDAETDDRTIIDEDRLALGDAAGILERHAAVRPGATTPRS